MDRHRALDIGRRLNDVNENRREAWCVHWGHEGMLDEARFKVGGQAMVVGVVRGQMEMPVHFR